MKQIKIKGRTFKVFNLLISVCVCVGGIISALPFMVAIAIQDWEDHKNDKR